MRCRPTRKPPRRSSRRAPYLATDAPGVAVQLYAEQFGQRPDQRVEAVRGFLSGRPSIRTLLILQLGQRRDVADAALLIQRGDRLGPRPLAPWGVDERHRSQAGN